MKKVILAICFMCYGGSLFSAELQGQVNEGIKKVASMLNDALQNKGGFVKTDKYRNLVKYVPGDNRLIIISEVNKKLYITDMSNLYKLSYEQMISRFESDEEKIYRHKVAKNISAKSICNGGNKIFDLMLNAGISIDYKTYYDDGDLYNTYSITKKDCAEY